MIETLTCPNCGQTVKSNRTHGLDDSKSIGCNACKLKSSLGQWRLNANDVPPEEIAPPTAVGTSTPPSPPHQSTGRDDIQQPQVPTTSLNTTLALWIAGIGLLLICLSPFFKWISVGAGGVTGLAGDGKVLLVISLVAVGAFGCAISKKAWMTPLLSVVQGWGVIVVFWMGSLLWKLSTLASQSAVEENVFAAMFSTMLISPGVGLYLGLIGAIAISGALGYLVGRRLFESNRRITFGITQAVALGIGGAVAAMLGPTGLAEPHRNTQTGILNFGTQENTDDKIVDALLGKPFTLGNLQITPAGFDLVTLRERPLFGDLQPRKTKSFVFSFSAKNISDGQVFSPYTSMDVTDNFGNKCADPTDSATISTSVTIDGNEMLQKLRPGETAKVKVAFDPQLENAHEYSCVLTTQTSNQDDYEEWRITFARGNAP